MAKLAPIYNDAQFINAIPATGSKVFTYAAGSTTKQTTYTDSAGLVPQANPIILNSRGEPASPIWLTEGQVYKFVFTASTDSDPPVSPIRTIDNITGVNDSSITVDQWVSSGLTPTYVSANQFTFPGDQTSIFAIGRRLKFTVTAGTVYGSVTASVFAALTTITVALDSGVLDSGLSQVQYGLISPTNNSLPRTIEGNITNLGGVNYARGSVAMNATTMNLWTQPNTIDGTGVAVVITAIVDAPQAGAKRILYPIVGTTITQNAMFAVDGGASYISIAGDYFEFEAITTNTYKVHVHHAYAGSAIFLGTSVATTSGTSIDFTGIPAWVKRVKILLVGVSTNGTNNYLVQIGDAGGIETSGYLGAAWNNAGAAGANSTAGLLVTGTVAAASVSHAEITLSLVDVTTQTWMMSSILSFSNTASTTSSTSSKALSPGPLDRIRLTTTTGVDTFDAGLMNISYE